MSVLEVVRMSGVGMPSPSPLVTSDSQDRGPVQTCSSEGLTVQSPPTTPTRADIWWMLPEANMVGKRAARILLECFLVQNKFS